MNEVQNHQLKFSIIKAIGIILIVIGHSATNTPLCRFVYLFNIAVFFFVSGYFFNDNDIERPLSFLKKKIRRLYIPWVFYGILFVLLHNIFLKYNLIGFNFSKKELIPAYSLQAMLSKLAMTLTFFNDKEVLLVPLWFLFGLFSGWMAFFSISWVSTHINPQKTELARLILIGISMVIALIVPLFDHSFDMMLRPFVISGLIYCGKLYRIYEHKIKLSGWVALLCLAGLLTATYLNYNINIGAMRIGNPLLFILTSGMGCYFVLVVAHYIENRHFRINRLLDLIGKNTLSIMALHYLSFKVVSLIQISVYNYPKNYLAYYPVIPFNTSYWWVAYTLVGVGIPLMLGYLYGKFKVRMRWV